MTKLEDMITELRVNELLRKDRSKKCKKVVLWVLAGIGIAAAVGAIAYGVYRFLVPGKLDEFEDDFEDDYDAYFNDDEDEYFDNEEEPGVKEKAEAVAEAAKAVKDAVDTVTE